MITDNDPINLSECTIQRLREIYETNKAHAAVCKGKCEAVEAELLSRLGPSFADALAKSGRQHGDVSDDVHGIKLTYSVKNKVEWDQDAMKQIAASMPWNMVERVFKIDFSVPEKTFKALTDDQLINKLTAARTVKYSDPKITFAK